jgi:twitching motility protein PilT
MPDIDGFLRLGCEQGCSDIHFTAGHPPLVRTDGELTPLEHRKLDGREIDGLAAEILAPMHRDALQTQGAVDLSYTADGVGRFRVNVCRHRTGLSIICRMVPERPPVLADLGLPPVISRFTGLSSGLVLVTGGAGTGKSTTLAALIEEINRSRNATVLTLEEPIEFVHESKMALIVQREVGTHVHSFHDGLRAGLREDPDVILVGELRDFETISLAIEASETGHLVLGTLHTRGAYQTIHRIVDSFPAEIQPQIRHTLAENLKCVVSQELVRVADGRGRRAVCEILVVNSAVAQLIREGKTFQIPGTIATGRRLGMQLMDQALLSMVQAGNIDPDEAFIRAKDKREFARFVTRPEVKTLFGGTGAPPAGDGGENAA